uniref:Uncharacterized protein n=1 Tax=Sus scrofa TaxID=9823 RepID=A0A480IH32_PIG
MTMQGMHTIVPGSRSSTWGRRAARSRGQENRAAGRVLNAAPLSRDLGLPTTQQPRPTLPAHRRPPSPGANDCASPKRDAAGGTAAKPMGTAKEVDKRALASVGGRAGRNGDVL